MRYLFAASLAVSAGRATELAELVEDGHWRKAKAIVDQRETAGQNDPRFLLLAAKVRFAYNDLEKAAQLAEKAALLDPKCADCQFLLYESYGSQAQNASILKQPGLARKCKRAVDQAVALDPKHVDALLGLMMYLHMAPGFFGGDKTRAKAIPGEIATFNPGRGHLARAQLAALIDRGAPLRDHYRAAVAADPNLFDARISLAWNLARQNPADYAEAAAQAREAVRLKPRRTDGWEVQAYALGRQGLAGEIEKMLAEFRRALPEEYTPHLRAAEGLLAAGKEPVRAEELIKQFLAQPPQGPRRPSHANAEQRLAQLYEKTGRRTEAVALYESVARKHPKNAEVQQALKRLRG